MGAPLAALPVCAPAAIATVQEQIENERVEVEVQIETDFRDGVKVGFQFIRSGWHL